MNNDLNSKIYICKGIKLDKSYKNVLNYSEANMLSLCQTNKVAEASNYSFIKHGDNKIKVEFSYSTCLKANYMAFQNTDYDSKWFFAFITKIEYLSEKATIIHFEVDVWETWFSSLTIKPCFVIREHVNNDTLGANTIPENLETGEYKTISHTEDSVNNTTTVVFGMTEDFTDSYKINMHTYNGIPAPLTYYRYDNMVSLEGVLQSLATAGKTGAIVSMFLCPTWLAPYISGSTSTKVDESASPQVQTIYIPRITALDGYTPKNKKLLCQPYCYIALSNGQGQYNTYNQEDWELGVNNQMVLNMYGVLTAGCSIRAVPQFYLGNPDAWDHSLIIGKFPELAWANDIYTNWLTQNGVNILGVTLNATEKGLIGGALQAAWGFNSGNAAIIGSGIGQIFGAMNEAYQKDMIPASVKGSLNSGDVMASIGANVLHIYEITIKAEYARAIDDYFNLFGYKVTRVKTPNITGRTYWNYIQIGGAEEIGYGDLPADDMEKINNIARAGTTIWHDHANIGNFNLNNTIVS